MPTPAIQTLVNDAQQVLNLSSISAVRATVAVALANANTGTPLNPNLTTQQLWDQFYQVVTQPKSDIESIIANQLMKFLYAPPAPGGVGADKQVIFNDGGTLAGNAALTFNKATGLLTAGSASITGDLTVDTSTLKVDSANNRVGIGTASPSVPLEVSAASPTAWITGTSTTGFSTVALRNTGASGRQYGISLGGSGTAAATAGNLYVTDDTAGTTRLTLDSSGNLGLGVTPSAWSAGGNIQLGVSSKRAITTSGTVINFGANWYYASATNDTYIGTGAATNYSQESGVHKWFNAPSGTAGNAITFTQAMTLDASGNLLVGTTNSSETSSVGHKINTSLTAPWLATVGSASTNGNVTSSVYSTGAAAYRFYVGYGGTVFATNTTISAISDARLKENVQDIDVGLDAILALKPRKFDWKAGKGKNIKGDRGFIAQEFETVFPNLIDEWKDPAPEGEAPYKSVRQDLIPVLVKAVQELAAEVKALKNA